MADSGPRKSILLIDDDDGFTFALSRLLEHAGYRVRRAANGDEGIRLAAEERPDAVLLDMMMPVKSGFEACQELKGLPDLESVPVIAMTAFGQNIGEIHGLPHKTACTLIRDILEKPVEPNVLLERLAKALAM
jgi:DNA-binding response OmpR family regulator